MFSRKCVGCVGEFAKKYLWGVGVLAFCTIPGMARVVLWGSGVRGWRATGLWGKR